MKPTANSSSAGIPAPSGFALWQPPSSDKLPPGWRSSCWHALLENGSAQFPRNRKMCCAEQQYNFPKSLGFRHRQHRSYAIHSRICHHDIVRERPGLPPSDQPHRHHFRAIGNHNWQRAVATIGMKMSLSTFRAPSSSSRAWCWNSSNPATESHRAILPVWGFVSGIRFRRRGLSSVRRSIAVDSE